MVSMEESHKHLTSFSLKSIQSLLLLLNVGYHGYCSQIVRLVNEFVYECYLKGDWNVFLCSQSKLNLLIKHKIFLSYRFLYFSILFKDA